MKRKGNKKGSAMALTVVVLAVASILFLGLLNFIISQVKYSSYMEAREKSLHIADAGINFYRWYLAHETDGMYMQEIMDFWNSGTAYGVSEPYSRDYKGIGTFILKVTPPSSGSTVVTVESQAWTDKKPKVKRTIVAKLRLRSWSEYAILANSNIYIEDGEEVEGRVHSNGSIVFDGICHNEVSSPISVSTNWLDEYNTNMGSYVFLGGKKVPVPEKDFDSVVTSLSQIFDKAKELNFDYYTNTKGHQIVLRGNKIDVYSVINWNKGAVTKRKAVALDVDLPEIAAIHVDKNVWVEGVLGAKKKLVIAADNSSVSHGNIFISNDIIYENYTSGSVLGLVAKNNVEVVESSENDLRIDAALLAQIGKVGRNSYGDSKNKITVYGAIATNQGYGFQGYAAKEIIFDSNLVFNPPPYFPIEGIYRLDFWNEI